MDLMQARVGEAYIIREVLGEGNQLRRLLDMGFTPDCPIYVESIAPYGGTILVGLRGFRVALRECAARLIQVERVANTNPI